MSPRHAVRLHQRSQAWGSIIPALIRTLPTLFDHYDNPTDAQLDFLLCVEEPICDDYIFFISKSYGRHADLVKNNLSHALSAIEHLLVGGHIREARYFVDEAILTHLETAIDIEALVRMLIRACPSIPAEVRNESCNVVISNVTYELGRMKCPKKHARLLFDFALAILELRVIEAPKAAEYLLEKNEFYPWKELAARVNDILRSCSAYDTIEVEARCSELDPLTTILRIVLDRARAYPIIFQATHAEALRAIGRWSFTKDDHDQPKSWSSHVYSMGETVLDLIDHRQITMDVCTQFIDALEMAAVDDESIDLSRNSFFEVRYSFR